MPAERFLTRKAPEAGDAQVAGAEKSTEKVFKNVVQFERRRLMLAQQEALVGA